MRVPARCTLFPYTTLFRSELPDTGVGIDTERFLSSPFIHGEHYGTRATTVVTVSRDGEIRVTEQSWGPFSSDRKSTRLNSSHVRISYAVFCLKKKINSAQV